MDAATALAAEGGLEDLTLNDIAERAGVGRPTIYRRWTTKEALLEDVVGRMVEQHFRRPEKGNIQEQLTEYLRGIIAGVQGPLRTVYIAFFNVGQANLAADAVQQATDRAEDMIRQAIKRGELRPDTDPHMILELMFGIVWYRATATNQRMKPAFAKAVVDAVLNSWLVADGQRRPTRRKSTS